MTGQLVTSLEARVRDALGRADTAEVAAQVRGLPLHAL